MYIPLDSSRLHRWWWYYGGSQSSLFWLWQQRQPLAHLSITDKQCHQHRSNHWLQYHINGVWIRETILARDSWLRITSLWLRWPTPTDFNITVSLASTQWRREGEKHHCSKIWFDSTGTTGCHGGQAQKPTPSWGPTTHIRSATQWNDAGIVKGSYRCRWALAYNSTKRL